MWRGLSLKCMIASCVAVFFLGVAFLCFFFFFRNRAYFQSPVRFDCVMAIRVDFSTPGTYSATITSKPRYVENAYLVLDLPKRVLSETDPTLLITGLKGTYEIIDNDGKQIIRGSIVEDPNYLKSHLSKNFIGLGKIGSWYEFVQWQINVNIKQGATNLKGIPQRLILFDRNSNLSMNEDIRTLFGMVNLILAIAIFIVIIVSVRKQKQLGNDHQKVKPVEKLNS